MPTPGELLILVVVPAAIVLAVRAMVALRGRSLPARPAPAGWAAAAVALAVVVGFLVGIRFGAQQVRPSFPLAASETSFWWVFWFAPGGLALSLVDARLPRRARPVLRVLAGVGAGWLMIEPVAAGSSGMALGAVALRLGLCGAVVAIVWGAVADAEARRGPVAASAVVALGLAGMAYALVGKSAAIGQTAAVLSAVLGAAAAPVPPAAPVSLPRASAGVLALVSAPLGLAAFTYLNVESPWYTNIAWPWTSTLLVAVAPAAGLLVPARMPRWVGLLFAAALAAALVAAAAVAGGILENPPDRRVYGY